MKNQALRRILCLCTAVSFLLPILGSAASAMVANMVSPKPSESVRGRYVEVSVGFNTESELKVTKLELWVNGRFDQKKLLVQPKARGLVTFNWDTAAYGNGAHYLLVKLFAGADVIATVTGTGNVGVTPYDINPPKVKFENVKNGEVLSGVRQIKLAANDDSGTPPMVSVFVDQSLKLLKNVPPFTYDLDTTTYVDGEYTIESYAMDGAGNQSDTASVKVKIRNSAATASAPVAAPEAPAPTVMAKVTTPVVAPAIKAPSSKGAARASESKPKITGNASTTVAKATKAAPVKTDVERVVVVSKVDPKPAQVTTSVKVVEPLAKTATVEKAKPAVVKPVAVAPKSADKPAAKAAVKPATPKPVQMAKIDLESSAITRVVIPTPPMPKAEATEPIRSITITEKPVIAKPKVVKPVAVVKPAHKAQPAVTIVEKPVVKVAPKPVVKAAFAKPAPKPIVKVMEKPASRVVVKSAVKSEPVKVAKAVIPVSVLPVVVPQPKPVAKVAATAKPVRMAITPKHTQKVVGEGVKLREVVKSAENASFKVASSKAPSAGRIKMRDLVNRNKGTVLWDSKTKTVTAYVNNIKIELRIGHSLVKVNGKTMKVSLVPYIQNGRTIVDIRLYHRALALAGKTASKTAKTPVK